MDHVVDYDIVDVDRGSRLQHNNGQAINIEFDLENLCRYNNYQFDRNLQLVFIPPPLGLPPINIGRYGARKNKKR